MSYTLRAQSKYGPPVSTIGMKRPGQAIGLEPESHGVAPSEQPNTGMEHPLLRRLFLYWSGKKTDQHLPSRRDIDPVEIGPVILPHILLTDVLPDGRLRYRLAGTAVEAVTGESLSGRHIDDLLRPPYLDYILSLYSEVIEKRYALYTESLYPFLGSQPERLTRRLMMPLVSEDDEVTMVLSGQIFEAVTDASYSPPPSPLPASYQETLRLVL